MSQLGEGLLDRGDCLVTDTLFTFVLTDALVLIFHYLVGHALARNAGNFRVVCGISLNVITSSFEGITFGIHAGIGRLEADDDAKKSAFLWPEGIGEAAHRNTPTGSKAS